MWENLLASWRQSGQKRDHCPSLLNHNAKYKRLLPPYCDFANGVRSVSDTLARPVQKIGSQAFGQGMSYGQPFWMSFKVEPRRVVTETVSGNVATFQRRGFTRLLDRLE